MSGSGATEGGGGGGTKRFSGDKPEEFKIFKSNVMASLLSREKKGDPPAYDTSTWGPFVIKQLDGDAAELFEDADLEEEISAFV